MNRWKITKAFPMLFYDLEDNPINSKASQKVQRIQDMDKARLSMTDSHRDAKSTERPPSSSAHADQGKPADGGKTRARTSRTGQHHPAAQTVEPVPANRDEQSTASGISSAARSVSIGTPQSHRVVNNNSTQDSSEKTLSQYINRPTVGQKIPKNAILQSIDDNDEIDEWDDINAWNNYFESAQQRSEANEKRERVNSEGAKTLHTLTLEDIFQKLQIDNYCKHPKLRAMLRELVAIYKDRFAVNVGSEPAAIPPFKIEVDDAKWSPRRPERYPRPQSRARQQAVHITTALADK
jgi:hypothetical protein